MHEYSVEGGNRHFVLGVLALLALGSAFGLDWILKMTGKSMPWWFDSPSVLGFLTIYVSVFENYIWKFRVARWTRLCDTPNFSGIWSGTVTSSFNKKKPINVCVTISQSWTRMLMTLETDQSLSKTFTAAFDLAEPGKPVLSYMFFSQANAASRRSMQSHDGAARLIFKDSDFATGDYFSGRGRQNIGRIEIRREL